MNDRIVRKMVRIIMLPVMGIPCTTCMMECFKITGLVNLQTKVISTL